ncbi:MAG: hypothetical protein B7Y50_13025 [Hydrogenophilales bacterium 28-61-11]|nr:MAG: hypothetical protein B7Y50_13025 [Hydrogenophilales bacterium 28-61-11]
MFVRKPLNILLSVALVAMAGAAHAAVPYTTPVLPVGDAQEMTSPYILADGWTQKVIANQTNQNALVAGSNSGNWDMIDSNRTGPDANRYLFMPFETSTAGVQRVDLWDSNYNTRTVTIVAPGTQSFKSGDASRWTPWGTYLTAEESWSDPTATGGTAGTSIYGRLFEITNPTTATANGGVFEHRKIGPADIRASHEGLAFDKANNFYFIDERNDSHIFKFTSANPNATSGADFFGAGQTSVLRVGDGSVQEAAGAYTWVALTDANGAALPGTIVGTDGAGLTILDGRATPNVAAFKGTDFDRPEDMEIRTLADGSQQLFVATTTNNNVFSLDLDDAVISKFVDHTTIDGETGVAVGSVFNSPDNLAIDENGTMYVIEDQPGGVENLWIAVDADKDGVAESMSVFATLRTAGAESTGMYALNGKFYVNVQHPTSGNSLLVEISPVPEAETYAMMLAGLGLVGFAASRRKSVK